MGCLPECVIPVPHFILQGGICVQIGLVKLSTLAMHRDDPFWVIGLEMQTHEMETPYAFSFRLYILEVFDCVGTNGEWEGRPWFLLTLTQCFGETSRHLVPYFL